MSNKAIYKPKGAALEYSEWACNFYVGCTGGCHYCYLKKGRGSKILGGNTSKLKACFKDEKHALEVFKKELLSNTEVLRKHGLFFSFTTDPMLPETRDLTIKAVKICVYHDIKVKILTKRTDWAEAFFSPLTGSSIFERITHLAYTSCVAFGFTLTGHDELEPGASSNADRIKAMKILHEGGYKTFASIEPIIDFESSLDMIKQAAPFCDLFKVGLESGKKYLRRDAEVFIRKLSEYAYKDKVKFYIKHSLRSYIPSATFIGGFVNSDYNLFTQ